MAWICTPGVVLGPEGSRTMWQWSFKYFCLLHVWFAVKFMLGVDTSFKYFCLLHVWFAVKFMLGVDTLRILFAAKHYALSRNLMEKA
jgi:hypothetical protein